MAVVVLLFISPMPGCESREQTVRIVGEDFRLRQPKCMFPPSAPFVSSSSTKTGNPHELKTALLAHQIGSSSGPSRSLPVLPNGKAETLVRTVPGVYVFYCAMRGHAGTSGAIIVD